jgi:hypothetical protein
MPVVGSPTTDSSVVLDPVSEDASNVELDVSSGNYGLLSHAYPAPPVLPLWASSVSTEGALLVSKRHDNRTISATVDVSGLGALQDLEAKLAKLYREGGTLKRVYSDGREIVFDVLLLDGYEPTFDLQHHLADVTTATFSLPCAPYGRGAEVTLSDHVETTLPWLVFTEASIPGDMPALGRLVVDNDSVNTQYQMLWGIQSRYYNAGAPLFYEAEAGTASSYSATATRSGASGGSVMRLSTTSGQVPGDWQPLVKFAPLAHVGSFRVFGRVYVPATNTGTISLRTNWRTTGSGAGATNTGVAIVDSAKLPYEGNFTLVDLGIVSFVEARRGDQNSTLMIEAQITATGDTVDLDHLALIPVNEGSGQARDPSNIVLGTGSAEIAYDGVWLGTGGANVWRPQTYEGEYLRVPPSGPEGRTAQVITKFTRQTTFISASGSDMASLLNDVSIDDLSARLYVTPRYLVVPEA